MYSHDYSKEISLVSTDKRVPKWVAALVLAVFGVVCFVGYSQLKPALGIGGAEAHSAHH